MFPFLKSRSLIVLEILLTAILFCTAGCSAVGVREQSMLAGGEYHNLIRHVRQN